MAERRMLSRKITNHDNFTSLPATTQALYLHLVMDADDDGFCDGTNIAMGNAHAKKKDLDTLVRLHYIIRFESGVYAVKHWQMQNAIRKDRYTPTEYQEELSQLTVKPNGAYAMPNRQPDDNQTATEAEAERKPSVCQLGNQTATNRQPDDNQTAPQVRLGKVRLGEDSLNTTTSTRAREDDKELGRVMDFYLDRVNPTPSATCLELLQAYTGSLGADVVIRSLETAVDERKTGWSYIQAILQRCESMGIRSLADWQRAEDERKKSRESKAQAPARRMSKSEEFAAAGRSHPRTADEMEKLLDAVDKIGGQG